MTNRHISLKREIFNRTYPAPFDNHIYPLYKAFMKLQSDALKLWQQDVVQQRLAMRDYVDLQDCRMQWHTDKDGVRIPVITLRPAMGIEVMEILQLYLRFFDIYKTLRNKLVEHLEAISFCRKMAHFTEGSQQRLSGENLAEEHQLFALLKILGTGMLEGALTHHDLDLLEQPRIDRLRIDQVNDLVKSLGLSRILSPQFQDGEADYFEHPNSEQMGAFWKYARKMSDLEDNQNLGTPVLGGGIAVTEETTTIESQLIVP